MALPPYDVPAETVKTIVKRHRAELNDYEEIRLLKGEALSEFKSQVHDELELNQVPSLQLLDRRGLLRLGMLLTESDVAKSVRNYLLNIEETADDAQREWAIEREISKRERRRLTDSIQNFFAGDMKGHEYSNFTNLAYKTALGCSATKLKSLYELERGENLRDVLTTAELRRLIDVEMVIASLIRIGKDYDEIRDELLSNANRF